MINATDVWQQWCLDRVNARPSADHEQDDPSIALGNLVADVWRIGQRAKRDNASDAVLAACERAIDDALQAGFKIETYTGASYTEELRVKVVENEGGLNQRVIAECIRPAVFFKDKLLSKAHVITRGTDE